MTVQPAVVSYQGHYAGSVSRFTAYAIVLVQREHRALHDLIAGSAVIYAWDARAARLRFLARQADLAPPPQAHSSGVTTPPAPVVIVT